MTVRRIVMNIAAPPGEDGAAFYRDLLGLDPLMDLGWITTWGAPVDLPGVKIAAPQNSFASEGCSGAPGPDISIEVDDVAALWNRAQARGYELPLSPDR